MDEMNSWPQDAIPEHWVASLFDKMHCYYGSKFADQWLNDLKKLKKIKEAWGVELGKLSSEELKCGVKRLVEQEWPPTLPMFVSLCRSKTKIDSVTAYYEAVAGCQERSRGEIGTWSHPAIFWAAVPLSYDLLNQTYSQIKARWEIAFNTQMEKTEWEEITKPILALAAPSKSRQDNTIAAQVLKQIGADEAFKPKRSDTEWYRKILERVKNGDKTVTRISRKFAEEAALAHGYKY